MYKIIVCNPSDCPAGCTAFYKVKKYESWSCPSSTFVSRFKRHNVERDGKRSNLSIYDIEGNLKIYVEFDECVKLLTDNPQITVIIGESATWVKKLMFDFYNFLYNKEVGEWTFARTTEHFGKEVIIIERNISGYAKSICCAEKR